jgi:signal transduction histidine kinase
MPRLNTIKSGKRILIIDDNKDYLDSTSNLLEREGHDVITCTSGQEGLLYLHEQHFDLLLLDYYIPGEDSCEELVKKVRDINPFIQMILQTGYSGELPPREILRKMDIQGYYDKSDNIQNLLIWVDVGLKISQTIQLLNQTTVKLKEEINEKKITEKELLLARYNLEQKVNERTKELEKSKILAESANLAKSRFLANMSHEIRTPLNVILGFAEFLYLDEKEDEKKKKLRIINQSGKYLLSLINRILDLSKIESGKLTFDGSNFSIKVLLNKIYNMFLLQTEENKLEFVVQIAPNVPDLIFGDEQKTEQILINIISNAFKFTLNGSVGIFCSYSDPLLEIRIRDTGIGIPREKHSVIFSDFSQVESQTTRKYSGTGLGLSISKKLTDFLNGKLSFTSEENIGTEFFLRLPVKKPKQEPSVKLESEKSEKTADTCVDFNILVVEDNNMNMELMRLLLHKLKVDFEFAENGKVAYEKLVTLSDSGKKIDLILLDIQMPVMDGYEFMSLVKAEEKFKDIYIIALTAYAIKSEVEKIFKAGCNDFISKPIEKELFDKKINALKQDKMAKLKLK